MPPTPDQSFMPSPSVRAKRWGLGIFTLLLLAVFAIGLWLYVMLTTPAANFPLNTPVTIESGSSIAQITAELYERGAVASELALYLAIMTRYTPADVKASTYIFSEPLSPLALADQLAKGDYDSNLIRITHREGERVSELAPIIAAAFPSISVSDFKALALPYEGTLFPETYLFPPYYTGEQIVTTMRTLYDDFVAQHESLYASSSLSVAEVSVLASIIEREANDEESMRMVAGILQNRLAIDMPLQADASMEYVLEKPLSELTPEDLRQPSPYNTYLNRGLPPTAIGNPGRTALLAVLKPEPSEYLFYITGNDGNFYYAETYEEHKRNIERYLR